jgi:hypothetical protein
MPTRSYKCDTFDEFLMNTTQLLNTGTKFHIDIFKISEKKNIKGKLYGLREEDTDKIMYFGGKNYSMEFTFDFDIELIDINNKAGLKAIIRQFLVQDGWRMIGNGKKII